MACAAEEMSSAVSLVSASDFMSLASRRKGEGTEDFGKTWGIYIIYGNTIIYIYYIMGIIYIYNGNTIYIYDYIWEFPFNANN